MKFMNTDNPLIIIDIGASGGIHLRWNKLDAYFKAILVEPDPREYNNLIKKLPGNYIVLNTALYDSEGFIDFNLCEKQMCSSIFNFDKEKIERYAEAERLRIKDTIQIKVNTLDNEIKHKVSYVDFIKIDAEGSELFILKGAKDTLDSVIGLEIETSFLAVRQNQPLFQHVNEFMLDSGFQLMDLRCDYWKRNITKYVKTNRKGQLIWADALYFRSPEDLVTRPDFDLNKCLRAFFIYMSYGYHDFAQVLLNHAEELNIWTIDVEKYLKKYLNKKARHLILPEFRGKGRMYKLILGVAELFQPRWWGAGGGIRLGNRF